MVTPMSEIKQMQLLSSLTWNERLFWEIRDPEIDSCRGFSKWDKRHLFALIFLQSPFLHQDTGEYSCIGLSPFVIDWIKDVEDEVQDIAFSPVHLPSHLHIRYIRADIPGERPFNWVSLVQTD